MAKTDIANLNVRLTASTSEFTAGMANAQRRLEQTTAVVTKSRAAFSGLGSAMRMPGLGRGAALGGAASGVAGALGLGALGGGVAGLAVVGGYVAVDKILERIKANEERRAQIQAQITDDLKAQNEALEEQSRKIVNANEIIAGALGGPRGASSDQLEKLNALGTEIRRLQEFRNRVAFNPMGLDYGTNVQEIDESIKRAREAERRIMNEVNGTSTNGLGDRLSGILAQDRDRGSAADVFNSLASAQRAARDAAALQAEADEETARAIRDAVADWKRENQKASDLLATTVGRISSQITQLTYRSN